MKKDMTRVLVESAIRRTLKNIQQSPKRMTRNLIDLGLQFSHGRFQTNLLKQAQKMLQDQQSAYYDLVKDLSATVDHDIITTFGVNLGYNSCTKGAVVIRDIEEEKKFNIPWALHVFINQEKLETQPDFYPYLLQQAMKLGIYTYLFYVTGDAEQVLPIIKKESDCAFILFLHGSQITPSFINKIKEVKNVMISIYADEDMASAWWKTSAPWTSATPASWPPTLSCGRRTPLIPPSMYRSRIPSCASGCAVCSQRGRSMSCFWSPRGISWPGRLTAKPGRNGFRGSFNGGCRRN